MESYLRDTVYVLSVTDSASPFDPVTYTTNMTSIRLTLSAGVSYQISLTAQRCEGNVTSNTSNMLFYYFSGIITCVPFIPVFLKILYSRNIPTIVPDALSRLIAF